MTFPRWPHRLPHLLVAGALFALPSACAPGYGHGTAGVGVVWISSAPPRPRYEERGPRPGVEFIWISGENYWRGDAYEWTPGRWERRPHPRARYVQGRWHRGDRGWAHQPGHWRN